MELALQDNLSLWAMDVPSTIPHFYQLFIKRNGTMGVTAGSMESIRMLSNLLFLKPMVETWGRGTDLIYMRIHTNIPGFHCTVVRFDLENCVIEAGGLRRDLLQMEYIL